MEEKEEFFSQFHINYAYPCVVLRVFNCFLSLDLILEPIVWWNPETSECWQSTTMLNHAFSVEISGCHDTGQNGDIYVSNTVPAANDDSLSVEEKMRLLMQADSQRVVVQPVVSLVTSRQSRDAVTTAALREAGVAGYQGDSDEEKSVEIAITNAQFQAKQSLANCKPSDDPEEDAVTAGLSAMDAADAAGLSLDFEEVVQISGYGKK